MSKYSPSLALVDYRKKEIAIYSRKGTSHKLDARFIFYNTWDLTIDFMEDLRINPGKYLVETAPEVA